MINVIIFKFYCYHIISNNYKNSSNNLILVYKKNANLTTNHF